MRTFFLTLTAAAAAIAAEPASRMSGPVLGYLFDPGVKGVRPISGVAGAASLDSPLPSASKLANGFVSPNGEWLIAVLLEGGVELRNLRSGETLPVDGAAADVVLAAWSSDANSFVLWSRAGVLQVWTGVLSSLSLQFSHSVEQSKGVAVAAGGTNALLWSESGLFSADATGLQQLLGEPVAAAAYRPGSTEWAAVSGVQLFRHSAEPRSLNVESPASVAFSDFGILVGGRGGVEGISAHSSWLTPCDCEATTLVPLSGANVLRLTSLDGPSLAIYDGDQSEPRIVYIPNAGGRQ